MRSTKSEMANLQCGSVCEGELRPTQRDEPTLAPHKHKIRKVFHKQLKRLWSTNQFLCSHRVFPEHGPASLPVAKYTEGHLEKFALPTAARIRFKTPRL